MSEMTERMLPLYEAKMIHHYDHRWATYERDGTVRDVTLDEKQDPDFVAIPRYWVREDVVKDRLEGRWDHDWLLGWRDICRSTDERTMIAAVNGLRASPEGGTLLTLPRPPRGAALILASWNSFVFDFVARQKVGGTHLKYFTVRQLPLPNPQTFGAPVSWSTNQCLDSWITRRVVGLIADSIDMRTLAVEFDAEVNPIAWSQPTRTFIRSELDAAFFHLYGIERDDVDYIMETFPIVKRKDIAAHGEYRTKRMILEIYDAMADAIRTGTPYVSEFDDLEEAEC